MLKKIPTLACVVVCVTLSTARADTEPETEAEAAAAPSTPGGAQLTLPTGRVLLDASFSFNLADGAIFKPFSLSPDLWYGATSDITVGLVHSGRAASGFIGSTGTALCLAGSAGSCADVYPGFGVDVRYRLKNGGFAWAADGGIYVRHFDPFQLAIKVGAIGRWSSGKLAIELLPNLFFGVTNRDAAVMGTSTGNKEVIDLPVTALYDVTAKIALALQVGAVLPLQATGDTYQIPLSIGGHYHVNESLNVNLAFSLPAVAGGGTNTGFDARTLTLGGTYAF